MNIRVALPSLILLPAFALTAPAADDTKEARKQNVKNAGLERFKQLAGDWVGKEVGSGKDGQEVRVNYKVTSAGSAVVETLSPSAEHEMVTVYHQDGDDLVLTHYCALGNQPHMRAERAGDGKKVVFKFAGASNLKSDKDMHMHGATFTFLDKDTLRTEWTHYKDGKETGTVTFELKRKK